MMSNAKTAQIACLVTLVGVCLPALAQGVSPALRADITRNRRVDRPSGTSQILDSTPWSYSTTRGGVQENQQSSYNPGGGFEASTLATAYAPANVPGRRNAMLFLQASNSYVLQNDANLTPSAGATFSSNSRLRFDMRNITAGIDPLGSARQLIDPVTMTWTFSLTMDTLIQRNFNQGSFDGVSQDIEVGSTFGTSSMQHEYHYFQFGAQTPRITTTGGFTGATFNQMGQTFNFSLSHTWRPIDGGQNFSMDIDLTSLVSGIYDDGRSAGGATESFIQARMTTSFELRAGTGFGPRGGESFVDEGYIISDDSGLLSNDGFAQDMYVPTPGAAALLGLAGLVSTRRRR